MPSVLYPSPLLAGPLGDLHRRVRRSRREFEIKVKPAEIRNKQWVTLGISHLGGRQRFPDRHTEILGMSRAVSLRSDLVRSWAAGGAPLDEDYTWHDAAQAWQTPELGEHTHEVLTELG